MATISYSLVVAGTACPWALGSGSSNTTSSGILVAYDAGWWDGTAAAGGGAGQNAAHVYGQLHTHAGETGPTTLSVTPGQLIYLEYVSGTINTQGSGATSCGPAGAATTGITPYPAGGCGGTVFPTNAIPGRCGFNGNGTVNTTNVANSVVTWVSGTLFSSEMMGNPVIWINNVAYVISVVTSPTSLTLTSNAGAQTGVAYLYWGAKTSIGGIVGAFTDAAGNVITNFDWASWGGVNPAGAFTLTSVSVAVNGAMSYNGTITGGASNAFEGYWFTITGCANAVNNGTFYCTVSTATALTLYNPNGIAETHSASAQQLSGIQLRVPPGATTLSLGINDTQLYDNKGSFSITALVIDAVNWVGGPNPFAHYGVGPDEIPQTAFGCGQAKMHPTERLAIAGQGQSKVHQRLATSWFGQLYPRGKN